jgi:hypothetical protein
MLEAVDLLDSYRQLTVHYSSMFGIMRRSYLAKMKAKETGPVDEVSRVARFVSPTWAPTDDIRLGDGSASRVRDARHLGR